MLLKKEFLTNVTKKGRTGAVDLLYNFCRVGQLPEPHFEYTATGTTKKRWHTFKVRFRVPAFLQEMDKQMNLLDYASGKSHDLMIGMGRDTNKQFAKSLAALEVIHRLEEALGVSRNQLNNLLDDHIAQKLAQTNAVKETPVTQQIDGVSWKNIPFDKQFPESGSRIGRIQFLVDGAAGTGGNTPTNPSEAQFLTTEAMTGARALTLASREKLPRVEHHSNHRDLVKPHNWANIRSQGKFKGVSGPYDSEYYGMDKRACEIHASELLGRRWEERRETNKLLLRVHRYMNSSPDSFGMAKLFVRLPKHRLADIETLVNEIVADQTSAATVLNITPTKQRAGSIHETKNHSNDAKAWRKNMKAFRSHQKKWSLPVDVVEQNIPIEAAVTLVRGGTGSGKTTRYPVMWTLRKNANETGSRTVVAQPRRLACVTAAQRVASELDVSLGESGCPIGYTIRFEARPSSSSAFNTIDFETPGVILRKAARDPLLSHMNHLVVDEVHERNADVDLLLALSKQAQTYRRNHPTLPPLQITLMSATLETRVWETYFEKQGQLEAVDVPDARRFPIDIVHVDNREFPSNLKGQKWNWLWRGRNVRVHDLDEKLCGACAELATHVLTQSSIRDGSILCFLPGMDEIRRVEHLLKRSGIPRNLEICLLHSSLSSKEQNKVFQPGPKIILSTNIAETSLTIPDVKVIIDSGRERQYSLLEPSSNDRNIAVVGSQLVTVDISQAAAKQRAGRAGRVSAGTCYRLYTQQDFDTVMPATTLPEMERMELSQLILHSLSLYHPDVGHPLSLLLGSPSPPRQLRLTQTLQSMRQQGFLQISRNESVSLEEMGVSLTPLGRAVSTIPASPRIGRMLFMGLALRAIDPALTMAALLSVPKALDNHRSENDDDVICSDLIMGMNSFRKYMNLSNIGKQSHLRRRIYEQVVRVRNQLEKAVLDHDKSDSVALEKWNAHSDRLAAQVALICSATPHIAHLTSGRGSFATRDVAGVAQIHPSSVNYDHNRRTHWYLYHELRQTRAPYLHVTTAVAPLELALFGESSSGSKSVKEVGTENGSEGDFEGPLEDWNEDWESADEWIYIVDQWVPVCLPNFSQRKVIMNLRRILNYEMLQRVASHPGGFFADSRYDMLVLNVLSSIENERIPT